MRNKPAFEYKKRTQKIYPSQKQKVIYFLNNCLFFSLIIVLDCLINKVQNQLNPFEYYCSVGLNIFWNQWFPLVTVRRRPLHLSSNISIVLKVKIYF